MGYKDDDTLSEALGVKPMPTTTITVRQPRASGLTKETNDEKFEEVRENIKRLIDLGEMSYNELVQVASSSQEPRAFEVLSSLLHNMVAANKQLLEIEKLKLEIDEKQGGNTQPQTVHNNLIVTSTADILEKLNKKKDEK